MTLKPLKAMPLPAKLMALFLFSQPFDYHALHLSTVTPDKVLFLVLAVLFGYAAVTDRVRSISMSGLEWCMLLFAVLCVVSYLINNPDGGTGRLQVVHNVVQSDFLSVRDLSRRQEQPVRGFQDPMAAVGHSLHGGVSCVHGGLRTLPH